MAEKTVVDYDVDDKLAFALTLINSLDENKTRLEILADTL